MISVLSGNAWTSIRFEGVVAITMRDHDVIGVLDALDTNGGIRVAILFYQNANTNTVTLVRPAQGFREAVSTSTI